MAREGAKPGSWTVIATLRHRPGHPTSIQFARAGERINTEAWSRSEGWCEHCRTRRARRTTYLLRHEDGRLAQVGSSCLAEFTSEPTRGRTLRTALRSPRRQRGTRPSRATAEYVETCVYLAHVVQTILDSGFTPASGASRQRPATWTVAAAALDLDRVTSARAWRRAEDALEWARQDLPVRRQLDDFERRLVAVLSQDRLTRRELPTAAAGIHAYHQHLRRLIAARNRPAARAGAPAR